MNQIIQISDIVAAAQGLSPITGDKVRPWVAAIILILSVIVLIGVFVFQKKEKDNDEVSKEVYEDEDQ